MSRYHGKYYKGARRITKQLKREEAENRDRAAKATTSQEDE